MKYMLMMNMPQGTGDYQINEWPSAALKAHMQFMRDLNRDLAKTGELVDGQGLTPPGQAQIVRCAEGGVPVISDGPFAETKEFLAGYWIIDVENPARAHQIAARVSSAPGPDGKPLVIPVEVRRVMDGVPASEG